MCACAQFYTEGKVATDTSMAAPEVYYPSAEESDDKEDDAVVESSTKGERRARRRAEEGKVDDLTEEIAFEGAMTLNEDVRESGDGESVRVDSENGVEKRSDDMTPKQVDWHRK